LINDQAHARTATALLLAYGAEPAAWLYAEPVLPDSELSPDLVLVHPAVGLLVVEVKAYELGYIRGSEGGELRIWRQGQEQRVSPYRQAQRGMYAIKNNLEAFTLPGARPLMNALVALPNINEAAWVAAGYELSIPRRAVLFADEINDPARLQARLAPLIHQTQHLAGLEAPLPEAGRPALQQVFGHAAVLGKSKRDPLPFKSPFGARGADSLGAEIERLEAAHKPLSPEQQALIQADTWGHPYLLRGVAGSGKSLVLAYQVAAALLRQAQARQQLDLFAGPPSPMPKVAALSLHRTLAPLLRQYIGEAYQNLSGGELPESYVTVTHLNGLIYQLCQQHPHFHYLPLTLAMETGERSRQYLAQLDRMTPAQLDTLRFDALYIDEGQDLHPDTLALLAALVRPNPQTQERSISIYYDDAQNIYGHGRPVWRSFGLNVEGGRADFMRYCYRNSAEVAELGLNLLLGAAADEQTRVQTRRFADIYTLSEKGLVTEEGGLWRVKFAQASGIAPQVQVFPHRQAQIDWAAEVAQNFIQGEGVRPEDILLLARLEATMAHLERKLRPLLGDQVPVRAVGGKGKALLDEPLLLPGTLTISTIPAAKGYDAPIVLLLDVDSLPMSVSGRALAYVGITRAKRYLLLGGVKTRDSLLSEAHSLQGRLF
jgi:hypothetical protein